MTRDIRNLQKISRSFLVSLPVEFLDAHGLRDAENPAVRIISNPDGSLTIVPEEMQINDQECIIEIYREVGREVVEKILSGQEIITLTSTTPIESVVRHEIHSFLRTLPQAEIMEETETKMVIYNMGFKKIPARKLLHRIFNIVSDLFKHIKERNDDMVKHAISELKKFYIILVGHTRSYHHKGGFDFESDEMTQKKSSDYRILAYQLKLLGYILRDLHSEEERDEEYFDAVRDYFDEIFDAFLDKDERTAYQLWFKSEMLDALGTDRIQLLRSEDDGGDCGNTLLRMAVRICRSMTALIHL